MSAQELVIDGGVGTRLVVKQSSDCVVFRSIEGNFGPEVMVVLNRGEQHLLMLYLQERLRQ